MADMKVRCDMRLKKGKIYSGDELEELDYEFIEEQCVFVDKQTRLFYVFLDEGNDCYSLIRSIKN